MGLGYINVDFRYPRHPKTRQLVHILGNGADSLPVRLWCWCAEFKPKDGRLGGPDMTPERFEGLVDWWGERGACFRAMLAEGWIDQREDGYYLHDWDDHQGHIIASSERGRAAAHARWDKLRAKMEAKEASRGGGPKETSQAARDLTDRLVGWMRKHDPKARVPDNLGAWYTEAERLLGQDGRGHQEAAAVLDWCQQSAFWRSNILSMGKFRAKYTQLLLRMQDENRERGRTTAAGAAAPQAGKYRDHD